MSHVRRILSPFVALLLLCGGAVALSAPANASGTCTHAKQTRAQTGLDAHRVVASCSWIAYDYKAKGTLVRSGGPDYSTQWFTRLNTAYVSGYHTCYLGCHTSSSTRSV